MVEVDENLDADLARRSKDAMVEGRALRVEPAVLINQAGPLDGRAVGVEAQGLEQAQVVLVAVVEVVAHVAAHAVVEVGQALVAPEVPDARDPPVSLVGAFRLRAGCRGAEEEVARECEALHSSPLSLHIC